MIFYALNFLLGIVVFSQKSSVNITNLELIIVIILSIILLLTNKKYKKIFWAIFFLLFGFLWVYFNSYNVLTNNVKEQYLDRPITIIGSISSIDINQYRSSFIFNSSKPFVAKLKLSWYGKKIQKIQVGEVWQLRVRLRANSGFKNQNGLDYEKYLFIKNIDATGYIRDKNNNINKFIKVSNDNIINQIRQKIKNTLTPFLTNKTNGGIIYALISGDRKNISKNQWQIFQQTNTSHLSVVSGLHIGIIGGITFLLALLLYKLCTSCCKKIPAQIFAAYIGIIAVLSYALLAGFSVSTQRASVMAIIVFFSIISRRHFPVWNLYAYALFAVLIINPLSVLSVGFWLSFFAVALILYGVKNYRSYHKIWRVIYMQLLISLAMLPLLFWFFQASGLNSFIANIIAIPIVSFVVLPASLLATILALLNIDFLANYLFFIANYSLDLMMIVLTYLKDITIFGYSFYYYFVINSLWQLAAISLAFVILFLPKGLKLRWLGIVALIALFSYNQPNTIKHNTFVLELMDSGQGLATIIKTKNHTLLFDAGFASRSGFNIGDSVVIPYLVKNNISKLDIAIISHIDNDHIGGLKYINDKIAITTVISSNLKKVAKIAKNSNVILCNNQNWHYDGVSFTILHPDKLYRINNNKRNNNSCVLKIDNGKYSALLTADIEKNAERYLVKTASKNLKADVLIVPHHGSNSSSGYQFLTTVSPTIAINSSGYKNRFRHPSKKVVNRYKELNIPFYDTQCSGQITLNIADTIKITEARKTHKNYWNRVCN